MTEYENALMENSTIKKLSQKADADIITPSEMNRLAGEYGRVAGHIIRERLLSEYPNGHATEEDIRSIVSPILHEMHKYISEATLKMINAQYRKNGIGIKATIPEYNMRRENEFVKELSKRSFEDELE